MTKKEALKPPEIEWMLELVILGQGLWQDSNDWRQATRALRSEWMKPLIDDGRVVEAGSHLAWPDGPPKGTAQFNYHEYAVTDKGIRWFLDCKSAPFTDKDIPKLIEEPHTWANPFLDGRGIGSELVYVGVYPTTRIAMRAVLSGYFEFVSYTGYGPMGDERYLRVRLTKAGMEYFDSLPRLVLECA